MNQTTVTDWKQDLPDFCKEYIIANIFDMDGTAFFFWGLPTQMLVDKTDNCKGGKLAKDRIMVVLACSVNGKKLKPMFIGKSLSLCCFKNTSPI